MEYLLGLEELRDLRLEESLSLTYGKLQIIQGTCIHTHKPKLVMNSRKTEKSCSKGK